MKKKIILFILLCLYFPFFSNASSKQNFLYLFHNASTDKTEVASNTNFPENISFFNHEIRNSIDINLSFDSNLHFKQNAINIALYNNMNGLLFSDAVLSSLVNQCSVPESTVNFPVLTGVDISENFTEDSKDSDSNSETFPSYYAILPLLSQKLDSESLLNKKATFTGFYNRNLKKLKTISHCKSINRFDQTNKKSGGNYATS